MEKHEDKTSDARVVFHDLLRYRFLSAPRFSPDGSRIAFAVHRADLEGNRYLSDLDRKSTRLNSSHQLISYAVFCLKKKKIT